jgi:hypothetical protein
LKRFLALSRLWITGLKPGVNEMRDFQTFEAKPRTDAKPLHCSNQLSFGYVC